MILIKKKNNKIRVYNNSLLSISITILLSSDYVGGNYPQSR